MILKSTYNSIYLNNLRESSLKAIKANIENKIYTLVPTICICLNSEHEIVSNTLSPNFNNTGINVVICKQCGMVRTNPYFSNDNLQDFYENHYRNLHEGDNSREEKFRISIENSIFTGNATYEFLKPFVDKYKKQFSKEKINIFEIGCGYGGNLYNFYKDGEEVYGCDYGLEGLEVAKEKGMLNMMNGDLSVLSIYGKPDVIIINHVLEHITNLKDFFSTLKTIITKDTLVYIGVPSLSSIVLRYNLNIYDYFMIYHVWHFTNNTLDYVMAQEGFEKIESNEVIQAVYKYTGLEKNLSLLSEYNKNKMMLEVFDKLYTKRCKDQKYRKYTKRIAILYAVTIVLFIIWVIANLL